LKALWEVFSEMGVAADASPADMLDAVFAMVMENPSCRNELSPRMMFRAGGALSGSVLRVDPDAIPELNSAIEDQAFRLLGAEDLEWPRVLAVAAELGEAQVPFVESLSGIDGVPNGDMYRLALVVSPQSSQVWRWTGIGETVDLLDGSGQRCPSDVRTAGLGFVGGAVLLIYVVDHLWREQTGGVGRHEKGGADSDEPARAPTDAQYCGGNEPLPAVPLRNIDATTCALDSAIFVLIGLDPFVSALSALTVSEELSETVEELLCIMSPERDGLRVNVGMLRRLVGADVGQPGRYWAWQDARDAWGDLMTSCFMGGAHEVSNMQTIYLAGRDDAAEQGYNGQPRVAWHLGTHPDLLRDVGAYVERTLHREVQAWPIVLPSRLEPRFIGGNADYAPLPLPVEIRGHNGQLRYELRALIDYDHLHRHYTTKLMASRTETEVVWHIYDDLNSRARRFSASCREGCTLARPGVAFYVA
jgi:hypothetical protein